MVGAILAGPSKWATALRSGFRHGLNNIGPDWDFGVVGQWIHDHESGMRTTGILLAVAMLLVTPAKSICDHHLARRVRDRLGCRRDVLWSPAA